MADLTEYCLAAARREASRGSLTAAADWLERVPVGKRPPDFAAVLEYRLAKRALADRRWSDVEKHLARANSVQRKPVVAKRLELVRRRKPLLDDHAWDVLLDAVDPAERLPPTSLSPIIDGVWACGAYHSRGKGRGAPWSKFLRIAKESQAMPELDHAVANMAGSFLCRFLVDRTRLLEEVDVVVAVPANPARYARRMRSLPDELARAVEEQLAVPNIFDAVKYVAGEDLRTRELSWSQRRAALSSAFAPGQTHAVHGNIVLVVDDVTTSGATLTAMGECLRAAGAGKVFAATMSHTEG